MQQSQAGMSQQSEQQYLISGAIDFTTAPNLMKQANDFFNTSNKAADETVNIDLSQVSNSNSAALALMLEMLKQARSNNIKLHFENLPEAVVTIAKAYGIDSELREFT